MRSLYPKMGEHIQGSKVNKQNSTLYILLQSLPYIGNSNLGGTAQAEATWFFW